jgi:hypothetical protein
MNRRTFLSLTGGTLGAAAARGQSVAPDAAKAREYYELRRYHLRRGPGQQLTDEYLKTAALPAWQRAGAGPIGVFNVSIGPESPTLYVLIAHKTVEGLATLPDRLADDREYQAAGAAYLNTSATSPAFVRIESSLMRAFAGWPSLQRPFGGVFEGPARTRLFELRTYESPSEKAGRKKIEMFETAEIAIFRRAGLQPVFFGETLIGSQMPNLTYMLVYENMAAHDKQWSAFGSDPDWKKLSSTPGYTDAEIVSNITNTYLRPTAYSQI